MYSSSCIEYKVVQCLSETFHSPTGVKPKPKPNQTLAVIPRTFHELDTTRGPNEPKNLVLKRKLRTRNWKRPAPSKLGVNPKKPLYPSALHRTKTKKCRLPKKLCTRASPSPDSPGHPLARRALTF
ncbi:uncharacterized protein CCOS01_08020 [Colletotrichum costaricense]|uniref:Uncharacterized protein n=1 Tax=Colletotrichum costaricense TaxID=1209916 RepID=A0AAI9YY42_9PEZI|nr:uncharacterized protein CCOS01_08020 [Colletotrichum costaricense]KAK1527758.1 hypothetical protein CCOS01_08020 [Colletotrichum costaricense]